jgi:phosphate transport system protein
MKILLKVAAFGLMAALASVRAQAQETPGSGTSPPADNAPVVLPEEKRWRIGAALGYGLRSNPLIQSDDIPIAIDLDLAWSVLAQDEELDAEFATALRQVMSYVLQDHRVLKPTIDTIFALKGLERVGDHAKNVAEQVLYMLGQDRRDGDRLELP